MRAPETWLVVVLNATSRQVNVSLVTEGPVLGMVAGFKPSAVFIVSVKRFRRRDPFSIVTQTLALVG